MLYSTGHVLPVFLKPISTLSKLSKYNKLLERQKHGPGGEVRINLGIEDLTCDTYILPATDITIGGPAIKF